MSQAPSNLGLADQLIDHLRTITILPRRMRLETPGVQATVPMLRGVWGAALHDLSPAAYREVIEAHCNHGDQRPQGYVIRLAAPDSTFGPAIDHRWIRTAGWTIGQKPSCDHQARTLSPKHIIQIVETSAAVNPWNE